MPLPTGCVIHQSNLGSSANLIGTQYVITNLGGWFENTSRGVAKAPKSSTSSIVNLLNVASPLKTFVFEFMITGTTQNILSFYNGNYNTTLSYGSVYSNGVTDFVFYLNGNMCVDSTFVIDQSDNAVSNTFQTFTVTIDSLGWEIFYNGVSLGRADFLESITRDYDVGIYLNNISQSYGKLSDIFIWNRVLSPAEIIEAVDYSKNIVIVKEYRRNTIKLIPFNGQYATWGSRSISGTSSSGGALLTPEYIEFDGTNSAYTSLSTLFADDSKSYDISLWFYPTASGHRQIISSSGVLDIVQQSDGRLFVTTKMQYYNSATGSFVTFDTPFYSDQNYLMNQWNYVYIRLDTKGYAQLWLNGIWQSTVHDISELADKYLTYYDFTLYFGNTSNYLYDGGLIGRIKKYATYNTLRSMSDVLDEWRVEYPSDLLSESVVSVNVGATLSSAPSVAITPTSFSVESTLVGLSSINALLRGAMKIGAYLKSRILKDVGKVQEVETIGGISFINGMVASFDGVLSNIVSTPIRNEENIDIVFQANVKSKFSVKTKSSSYIYKSEKDSLEALINSRTEPFYIVMNDGYGVLCSFDYMEQQVFTPIYEGSELFEAKLYFIES